MDSRKEQKKTSHGETRWESSKREGPVNTLENEGWWAMKNIHRAK